MMYLGIFLIDLLVVGLNQGADPLCNGESSYFDVDLSRRLDGGHCTVHVPVHQHFYLSGNSSIYLCWRSDVCLGISSAIMRFANAIFGRIRGAAGAVTIVTCALRSYYGIIVGYHYRHRGMMLPELEKSGICGKI